MLFAAFPIVSTFHIIRGYGINMICAWSDLPGRSRLECWNRWIGVHGHVRRHVDRSSVESVHLATPL